MTAIDRNQSKDVVRDEPNPSQGVVRDEPKGSVKDAGSGMMVYAAMSGLVGVLPLPFFDGLLSGLARGAAMRRVAARHGVVLTPGARAILAERTMSYSGRGRLLQAALSSVFAPVRLASRVQDVLATVVTSVLLDRFLRRPERPAGAALTEVEARRVRAAIDHAAAEAGIDAIKTVPLAVWDVVRDAVQTALRSDAEKRSIVERFVDALLDGASDAPNELFERLGRHFDQALDEGTT